MNIKTRPLSMREFHSLLMVSPPTWRYIFSFAYITAFRVSDIIDMKIDNITGNCIKKIEIKTHKEKTIQIGSSLNQILVFFLDAKTRSRYSKYYDLRRNYVFPFSDPSTYRKSMIRYASYAMIDLQNLSFHSFRKTAANEIAKNLNIVTASAYLNHSNISTTMKYLDYDAIEVSSILESNSLLKELGEK